ncbi:DUF4085 family protein [Paenibacillus urinalis]|uniref:DUF4085 family protein n=1 Tax=Paenibacillus urinalis TaxID=521520 RepID=A0ABY7XCW7_9BACL|nr:DUF4085 family protein [Paenibacillus urinalis]WDH95441.1 DUF4085 family protein [Paenibacillus urinalis]WDI03638.1 DUF4085 family protein [Paenibacillus urinalis]
MRYFTVDLYNEMQVRGCMGSYFESEEQRQEEMQWLAAEGRDFYQESRDRFEWLRPHMLQFLPAHLLKYVYDESIMDCYIHSPEMKAEIGAWKKEWDHKWKTICDRYWEHYKSIQEQLPAEVRRLDKEFHLHDARIIDVRTEHQQADILLDVVGYSKHQYQLCFTGVKVFNNSPGIMKDVLLYPEIDITEGGLFEIRILMNSMNIFHIIASDLSIEIIPVQTNS